MTPDSDALLVTLIEGRVEFLLIGGFAATVHGSTRFTADLDVLYERSSENIERLARVVGALNPYLRGAPPGLPFRFDARTRARAAGRPKDFEAVAELEVLLEEKENL